MSLPCYWFNPEVYRSYMASRMGGVRFPHRVCVSYTRDTVTGRVRRRALGGERWRVRPCVDDREGEEATFFGWLFDSLSLESMVSPFQLVPSLALSSLLHLHLWRASTSMHIGEVSRPTLEV